MNEGGRDEERPVAWRKGKGKGEERGHCIHIPSPLSYHIISYLIISIISYHIISYHVRSVMSSYLILQLLGK